MELNLTAKKSPRIENGKIYWYEGDTFSIEWTITLTDETTHEEIDLSPLDTVLFKFSNTYKNVVYECECEVGENGKVILEIPKEVSEKFAVGTYTYSIKYKCEDIITVAANGIVEVEACQ